MKAKSKINRKYGCIPDQPNQRDFRFGDHHPVLVESKQGSGLKQFLPPVINQLSVGMCTGCGSSRAVKTLLNSVGYKWPFMPSALGIYAMVRAFEGVDLTQDTGASIADVMSIMNSQGVIPEDSNSQWSWPFSASDDRWQQMPPEEALKDAALHKLIKYMRVPRSSSAIKSALNQGFPLVIGVSVYESFESNHVANTGVIPIPKYSEEMLGGHCLFLYDYAEHDSAMADGQNSWGPDWGDQGRFHIPFEYLCDESLTSDIWAIELVS